jgi:hypothetical protein
MCTKKRFSTRAGALLRIAEIKRKGEVREVQPIRGYYCGECGGYHLTSQPMSKKKSDIIKRRKEIFPEKVAQQFIKKNKW